MEILNTNNYNRSSLNSYQGMKNKNHSSIQNQPHAQKTDRVEINHSPKDFKANLNQQILDNLFNQKKESKSVDSQWIDPILYAVDEGTEAAEVPEYWNAENTSQRIVDFAVSFLSLYEGDNESYHAEMKEAIKKGFEEAKGLLGELPGESAKLFNDTYELSMKKLDEYFENLKNGETPIEAKQPEAYQLDLVA